MSEEGRVALQREIRDGIPASEALGFEIAVLEPRRINITAPLGPNINVHGTGFAGSLYALGILAAWGMVRHLYSQRELAADLVVAEATIRYHAPVRAEIVCECAVAEDVAEAFLAQLEHAGRARMTVEVAIGDERAATLKALMVATTRAAPQ